MTVSNNKELLLEVNHLGVSFKIKNDKSLFFAKPQTLKAVKDVSFKLYEGETLGVVGESGCGKSTLARAIIGLVEASEGEILWLGKNLRKQSAKQWKDTRKDIQMIFQDPLGDHCDDLVHHIQDFLNDHFAQSFTLADLARRGNVSERTLSRSFMKNIGLTPSQYQRAVRLEHAELLVAQGATMEQAARQVGFADARSLRKHRA